jgi:glycolate oxidase
VYREIDENVVKTLTDILGKSNVIIGEEDRADYACDETPDLKFLPEVVVKPANVGEVAEVMRIANEKSVPITPRGAGTGLSGGALPVFGGILMSMERMDRILEIDGDNLMVTTEPAVITGRLQEAVEEEGFFYPPDPASLDSCSIGGNVAEGAGGPRAVKYGVTGDYVRGLEVVLPTGEIITCGGKLVKNVTGYDLNGLLVGSEGTLAIVTKIVLQVLPLPQRKVDLLIPFHSLEAAAQTVSEIIRSRIIPTAIEFMEREAIQHTEQYLNKEVPFHDAEAQLLIEIDGHKDSELEHEYETIGEIFLKNGAYDVFVADSSPAQRRLWEVRRSILEALKVVSPILCGEDVVVPRMAIPPLITEVKRITKRHGFEAVCFGHVGDGNVHIEILKGDIDYGQWRQVLPAMIEEIFDVVLSLKGMITGEHGIGFTKKKYLPKALGKTQVELMRRLKRAFDPNTILNPGKIFDENFQT